MKLSPSQLKLYGDIDKILFFEWDPVGVSRMSDAEGARDEYQPYIPRVFKLAIESDAPEPIAQLLTELSTQSMGLPAAPAHDLAIAQMIISAKG
ncbi:hypothetical protein [Dongshaea marina]|uniref:hypothetical protein n=1 Tax=Dongshaea marina TaxID=2047966 RepID=UPI000D3E0C3E|nr:hypothetical protein [Dongshaea marina]